MKRFYKFLLLVGAPLFFMALISTIVSGNFDDLKDVRTTPLVIGFFCIIAYSQVYVFEKFLNDGKSFFVGLAMSGMVVFSTVMFFSMSLNGLIFNQLNAWVALSQGLLCLVLFVFSVTVVFLLERRKQTVDLAFKESNSYYAKLALGTCFFFTFLFSAMSSDQYLLKLRYLL